MDKAAEVLARLREERARLAGELAGVERAIAALEEAMAGPAPVAAPPRPEPEPPRPPLPSQPPPPEPPPGPYRRLGFYQAAVLYLREAGEPKSAREIAEALLAGGYRTDSRNFVAVARTMLGRPEASIHFGIQEGKRRARWYVEARDPDANA
jgi:hypothetical protein